MKKQISIIIPAYNEEKSVLPLYENIKKVLENLDYELIFINDGSQDKTLDEMNKIKDKRAKVVNQEHRGKAFALYNGLQNARNEIIATLDCDLQDDPADDQQLPKQA